MRRPRSATGPGRPRTLGGAGLAAAAAVVLALVWVAQPPDGTPPAPPPLPASIGPDAPNEPTERDEPPAAPPGSALGALDRLPVKGRAPLTGYSRDAFGGGWLDLDGDGCDTREEVLDRDLVAVVHAPSDPSCTVAAGLLHDPYSGAELAFSRGPSTSAEVQIDHVVALADAWQKGAQQWDGAKRIALANDPLNLLAVDGDLNQQKSASDAASWMPPDRGSWCDYAVTQVSVKDAYGLWVTQAEHNMLARALRPCPAAALRPSSLAEALPATRSPSHGGQDPRYSSCARAIADGVGPYRRGQDAEYEWYTDADQDGVVCER